MSDIEKYNFEDVIKLREEQNKKISIMLDKSMDKYIKQFFKDNKSVYRVSLGGDWCSNDEGGSSCYINVSLSDKKFDEIDDWDLSEKLTESINELPNDLREEIGSAEYFRSPAIKAKYESRYN